MNNIFWRIACCRLPNGAINERVLWISNSNKFPISWNVILVNNSLGKNADAENLILLHYETNKRGQSAVGTRTPPGMLECHGDGSSISSSFFLASSSKEHFSEALVMKTCCWDWDFTSRDVLENCRRCFHFFDFSRTSSQERVFFKKGFIREIAPWTTQYGAMGDQDPR